MQVPNAIYNIISTHYTLPVYQFITHYNYDIIPPPTKKIYRESHIYELTER